MGRCTDKNDLASLFPIPCEANDTTGIGDGVILRFKTFYLKIYDYPGGDSWAIQGFIYGYPNPIFVHRVPYHQMRSYASQFIQDDYLRSFRAACRQT